jgi:hypothetical protein
MSAHKPLERRLCRPGEPFVASAKALARLAWLDI